MEKKARSPQEKKELSYARDCRDAYGEHDKGSRRSVRRRDLACARTMPYTEATAQSSSDLEEMPMKGFLTAAALAAGLLAGSGTAEAYITCPQGLAGRACGSESCNGKFTQLFHPGTNNPSQCACVCANGTIVNVADKDAAGGGATNVGTGAAAVGSGKTKKNAAQKGSKGKPKEGAKGAQ